MRTRHEIGKPPELRPYRCDGCDHHLCEACVQHSHRLDLCRLCGERALPIDAPSHRSQVAVPGGHPTGAHPTGAHAIGLLEALRAPLTIEARGVLALLVLASLATAVLPTPLPSLFFFFAAGSVAIRIARHTARGLPGVFERPDFRAAAERMTDVFTWLGMRFLHLFLFVFLLQLAGGVWRLNEPPTITLWVVAAIGLWLGTALGMMALSAAGGLARIQAINLLGHVRGFLALGAEGINLTNILFGLGALTLGLRGWLEACHPIAGGVLASLVAGYWLLLEPYLAGLLFARNRATLETAYGWGSAGEPVDTDPAVSD